MGGSGLGFFCPRVGFVQVLRVCSGFVGLFSFLIKIAWVQISGRVLTQPIHNFCVLQNFLNIFGTYYIHTYTLGAYIGSQKQNFSVIFLRVTRRKPFKTIVLDQNIFSLSK